MATKKNETVRLISESTGGEIEKYDTQNGKLYIEGVFSRCDIVNANGHIYPKDVMEESVNAYIDTYVANDRALGELNHPQHLMVDPKEACIKIEELELGDSVLMGRAVVLDGLPNGKIVRGLIEAGVRLGVSTRGGGKLVPAKDGKHQMIDKGFDLVAIDVVTDPAVPDAFVNGVYQSREFIRVGDTFKYTNNVYWDPDVVKEIMKLVRMYND